MRIFLSLLLLVVFCTPAITNVINVSDFGAIANDNIDDTKAINDALAACNKSGATLNFTSGKYLIEGAQANVPIFSLSGYHNLTINGNSAFFSCKNWDVVFYVQNSTQVNISGITIDWDRDLPFSYGTITAKGSGYIDVTLASPQSARAGLKAEAILQYDTVNMKPVDNGYDCYQNGLGLTEILSSDVMRCYTGCYYNVGENVIVRHQVYMFDAFSFINNNGVTLNNIVIYSAAGMGLVGFSNKNIAVNNYQIKCYGTRWMSTCADGIHFSSTRGTINITNSLLQGMGDDGMNIHGMYYRVQYVSGNYLCLQNAYTNSTPNWYEIPLTGDTLVILDPATLIKKGEAIVISSSPDAGSACLLVKFNNIGAGVIIGDQLYIKNAIPALNVSNTTIDRNRARGMLIQTSNVNISGTTFNQSSGPAILLTTTTGGMFIESSAPKHVTISGCTFYKCNYGTTSMNAPLMFYTNTTTNQYANAAIGDIHINNNTFTTIADQPGVYIRSANNVYLDSNKFTNNSVQQIDYIYDDNEYCTFYVDRKAPTGASAYGGTPVVLPAKIEAENFDDGGEGIGYHDVTMLNQGNSDYRSGERVDIFDNGSVVGINYAICSEWLGYTVNVPQDGYYTVIVRGSTALDGASYHLEKDFNSITPETQFPNTGGWDSFQSDSILGVYLTQGTYQIKFVWDNYGISLDYLQFDPGSAQTAINLSKINNGLMVYPDPFTDFLSISIPNEKTRHVQLFDITSHLVFEGNSDRLNNLTSLPVGIYYLHIITNSAKYVKAIVKVN